MPRHSIVSVSVVALLSLVGTPARGQSEGGQAGDLNERCSAVVRQGEALLRRDADSPAAEAATQTDVQDALVSCLSPAVAPETRARLLLVASRMGETNEFETALKLLEDANKILVSEAPRSKQRVLVLEALSSSQFALRRFEVARASLEEALRLREDLWGLSSPEAIDGQIALVYFELAEAAALSDPARSEAALSRAQSALEASQRLFGPEASVTTRSWAALSAALRELGQVEKAQAMFEEHVAPRAEDLDEPLRDVALSSNP